MGGGIYLHKEKGKILKRKKGLKGKRNDKNLFGGEPKRSRHEGNEEGGLNFR